MKKRYLGYFGSIGKKLLRAGIHASVVGLTVFNFSGSAEAKSDSDYAKLFFQQGYGYCDARKLAKVWGGSIYQAKVTAGRKISWGNLNILQADWRKGVQFFRRYGFSCGQSNLSKEQQKFAYNDSSRVVDAWKKDSRS